MGSHIIDRTIAEGSFSETFSTLNLLRNYNNLIASNSENRHLETYPRSEYLREPSSGVEPGMLTTGPLSGLAPTAPFSIGGLLQPPLLAAVPPLVPPVGLAAAHPFANASAVAAVSRNIIENAVISSMHHTRRPRSEKKPIPDEQKDEKYYERRKRNNQAAKKSRDARKIREDQIALRATVLEYENARLRARMVELYEECQSLRQLLIKERLSSSEPPPPPPPPSAPSHASSTSSGDPLSNRVVSSTVVSSTPTKSASISLGPSPC